MVQQAKRISALDATTAPAAVMQFPVIVGTGATVATYRISKKDLLGGVFDVREYGAVPTLTTTAQATLNTAAIQAAALAAHAAGGGVVFIPAGDWYFQHGLLDVNVVCQIDNLDYIVFSGAGVGVTELHIINGAESNMFNLTGGSSYITIRDMTIDGNRANQTLGVSGIRGDAFSGLWLQNLHVHDIFHYGIAFEGFVQEFIFMDNIKLENLGGDGFDQKNKSNANIFQCASNIEISNFGLNYPAEVTQTGWDCRGAWQCSNFVIHFTQTDGSGIRIRNTGGVDVGYGGHRSHFNNFEIHGPGAASTALGIEMVGRDVQFTNGYIRDCFYGVLSVGVSSVDSGSGSDEVAERSAFDGVTAENCNVGFITSATYANDQSYHRCRAVGCTTGFRARSSGCTYVDCRAYTCTAAGFNTDASGTFATYIGCKVVGVAGVPTVGMDIVAADCKVHGGDITTCATNLVVSGARFTAIGLTSRSATGDNNLVAVGGDDATFTDCNSRSATTEGYQTRAARTTIRGGQATSNGGLGFQSEATATNCVVDSVYMTGNTADFDDQGVNTVITQRTLVGVSLNEAVAAAGTSANIDVAIVAATTVMFLVEAQSEDSASARRTIRTKVQAYRSASGSAVVSAGTNEFTTGAGTLTINLSGSGNNLRVSVTNGGANGVRLDTRITELFRQKTVEHS